MTLEGKAKILEKIEENLSNEQFGVSELARAVGMSRSNLLRKIKKLTDSKPGSKLINGTFDWAYEEEFSCLDGFRWGPDGKSIAYWQIDANTIRDFYMINTTDSIYSYTIPVEYPKVGEAPSACRVGVVDVKSGKTTWMDVKGDPQEHYIIRMEYAPNGKYIEGSC